MSNEDIIPFRLEHNVSRYDPFDALWRINPEIASIAYAHREGVLQPEVLPLVARFRELQTTERLGVLNYLTENARIGSDERMNLVINQTQQEIARLQEDGATTRVTIHEKGETSRAQIQCDTAMDISRLKYDAKVRIINAQIEGQKYLSDNQLRATYIEAQALRDAILGSEKIRAMARMKESQDRLTAVIRQAEFEYLNRIKEAEELRAIEYEKRSSEVINNYLMVQAQLFRHALRYQLMQSQLKLGETKATYEGFAKMVESACGVLSQRNIRGISISGQSLAGPIKLDVDIK